MSQQSLCWNTSCHISHCVLFYWLVPIQSSDLHWAMLSALVGNKPQFVRLLLENGVNLRDFLQEEETLCELYKEMPGCFFLGKLAKRVQNSSRIRRRVIGIRSRNHSGELITMTHVSGEVRHLLGSFTQPLYLPSTTINQFNMSIEDSSSSVSLFQHVTTAKLATIDNWLIIEWTFQPFWKQKCQTSVGCSFLKPWCYVIYLVFIPGAGGFIILCDFLSLKNFLYYLTCRQKKGYWIQNFPTKISVLPLVLREGGVSWEDLVLD